LKILRKTLKHRNFSSMLPPLTKLRQMAKSQGMASSLDKMITNKDFGTGMLSIFHSCLNAPGPELERARTLVLINSIELLTAMMISLSERERRRFFTSKNVLSDSLRDILFLIIQNYRDVSSIFLPATRLLEYLYRECLAKDSDPNLDLRLCLKTILEILRVRQEVEIGFCNVMEVTSEDHDSISKCVHAMESLCLVV
jgi:hypothetical protein